MKNEENMKCNATTTDELYDFMNEKQDTGKKLLDFDWVDKGMNFIDDGGDYDTAKYFSDPHNMKPDLEKQWGKKDSSVVYTEDVNMPRSLSIKASKDDVMKAYIQKTATRMMNAGASKKDIVTFMGKKIVASDLQRYASVLTSTLENYGSTGRFILDSSTYGSCREASKDLARNPFKNCIGFVRNCSCHNKQTVNEYSRTASGGGFDDFLGGGATNTIVASYQVCPETGFRIFAGESDIDEQWAGDTSFDLINACGADMEDKNVKVASDFSKDPYKKLVAFSLMLDGVPVQGGNEMTLVETEPVEQALESATMEIEMGNPVAPISEAIEFDGNQNDDYFSDIKNDMEPIDMSIPQEQEVEFAEFDIPEGLSPVVDTNKPLDIEMGTVENTETDDDYFTTASGGIIELEKKLDCPVVEFGLGTTSQKV